MKNNLHDTLLFLRGYLKTMPRSILSLLINKSYWSSRESYYPDKKHKPSFVIFLEQLLCVLRWGEIDDFYFLYGFDLWGGVKHRNYIQHCDFRYRRNKKNFKPFNEVCILRNKELFSVFGNAYGLNVVDSIGILKSGILTMRDGCSLDFCDFIISNQGHYFCKIINGECGVGIFSIDNNGVNIQRSGVNITIDELKYFVSSLGKVEYLIQHRIVQHKQIDQIYSSSINTLRIITIRNKENEPILFDSLLRIGANGNEVDNWAQGGIIVGVSNDGELRSNGYFKPQYGKIVKVHPNTNITFEGFKIPYYEDAVDLCIRYHKKLRNICAIGWDVAITEDGPILIEGNDNFEISMHQACYKGLKQEIITLLNN